MTPENRRLLEEVTDELCAAADALHDLRRKIHTELLRDPPDTLTRSPR